MRVIPPDAAQPASDSWPLPAPTGGWNARDARDRMPATDALQLDNWFPSTTDVVVRPGSTSRGSVPDGEEILTLMGVSRANGTYRRFAATALGIYNITAGVPVTSPAEVVSNGFWQSVQLNVGGISYLWCCCGDGTNKVRLYNSTANTWLAMDGATTPAFTGLDSRDVTNVSLWKYRLILCERDSMKFWYGPLNSVGGAFSAFDLGSVFKKGGYLVATANWTIDAGDGADDHFVAMSSEGEIAVYQGTDPSNASTFNLVGVYNVGKPIGKRCFVQLAGDLGVLTEQGLWPLSKALQSATVDKKLALTDKIQSAFNQHFKLFGNVFGWHPVLLPKGPAILVNMPVSGETSYQYVMNTITGAWCRFLGWDASCLLVNDGKLFYAIGNQVYEGWTSTSDSGNAIPAFAAQAYSYGPTKRAGKKIKMVRPMMRVSSPVNVSVYLNSNFSDPVPLTATESIATTGSLWGTAIWGTSLWGGTRVTQMKWKGVNHFPSRAFSLQVAVNVKKVTVSWSSTDFIGERTGVSLV